MSHRSRAIVRDFTRRILWSLFLAGYYALWIYLTEAYIHIQKVPMLTRAEFRFTQDQVGVTQLPHIPMDHKWLTMDTGSSTGSGRGDFVLSDTCHTQWSRGYDNNSSPSVARKQFRC